VCLVFTGSCYQGRYSGHWLSTPNIDWMAFALVAEQEMLMVGDNKLWQMYWGTFQCLMSLWLLNFQISAMLYDEFVRVSIIETLLWHSVLFQYCLACEWWILILEQCVICWPVTISWLFTHRLNNYENLACDLMIWAFFTAGEFKAVQWLQAWEW
jgi:hypothetical protein